MSNNIRSTLHKLRNTTKFCKPISTMTANETFGIKSLSREQYETSIRKALQRNREHLAQLSYPGSKAILKEESLPLPTPSPTSKIFFFDIDNCLYKRSTKIHDLMQVYIHEYVVQNLEIGDEEALELRERYYKSYGLAIQGLVKYHKIDALEYNEKVDDALPLQDILKPDPNLRQLLIDLRSKGKIDKLWLFTNAYKNHAKRVISLLGIGDLFDGLTYCDYTQRDIICKPNPKMFEKAMMEAGASDYSNCYFIDDSAANIKTSVELGLKKSIHFVERDEDLGTTPENAVLIRDIMDLPKVVPELFE